MPLVAPPQPLTTPRLALRLVQAEDLPALMAVNGDEAVTRFLPYATWQTLDDAQAWLTRMEAAQATGTALQFVITQRTDGLAIGSALLFRHDEGAARAELGYVLGRAHWGKGVMHEALHALLQHAFHGAGLRRIEAEVNPANVGSMRVLQALGFMQEGLLRQRWVGKDGQPYDIAYFGLLREEAAPALQPPSDSDSATR